MQSLKTEPASVAVRTTSVTIVHACLERGVKVELELSQIPDPQQLAQAAGTRAHIVEGSRGGFFRLSLGELVAVSAVLRSNRVTAMYSILRREQAVEYLDHSFPGYADEYEFAREDLNTSREARGRA